MPFMRFNRSAARRASRNHSTEVSRLKVESLEERALLSASVWTDKLDYLPGETAIISGSGFNLGETVRLHIMHEDGLIGGEGHLPWSVTDGGIGDNDGLINGNIQTSWYVNPDDSAGATFSLTAIGLGSGRFTQASFTDSGPEPPNSGNASIGGVKFYDLNADGNRDHDGIDNILNTLDDEAPINGWIVTLYKENGAHPGLQVTEDVFPNTPPGAINPQTTRAISGVSGAYLFGRLSPGTYYVVEDSASAPFTGTWVQTLPSTNGPVGSGIYQVTLTTNSHPKLDFGNAKLVDGAGLSKGFWTNHPEQVTTGDLAALAALNLRNSDGSHFDPATVSQLSSWLSGGGSNMARKLSQQLAAMTLNVRHGNVGQAIYAPGAAGADANGFVSIDGLMLDADATLAATGNPTGSVKDYQESLKNELDGWNNTAGLATVAGLVYADTNNDGIPDTWVAPF